jgi:hypothetical protein
MINNIIKKIINFHKLNISKFNSYFFCHFNIINLINNSGLC